MRYEDFDDTESDTEDNDDVLCRLKHENGTMVTLLTAPASLFTEQEELEPMVFGICEGEVCVALNEDVIEQMIKDGILTHGETYGMEIATLLPTTLIIRTACKAASTYIKDHEEKQGSQTHSS